MSEAIKPTPGPAYHHGPSGSQHSAGGFINNTPDRHGSPVICSIFGTNGQPHEANANLIVEAFNVHHETGLTPRQLVERVKELEEALRDAVACGMVPKSSAADGGASKYSEQVLVADRIRAALSKSLPNTVAEVK